MRAFTAEKKAGLLAEIARHREADQIAKGTYGTEVDGKWRGCAVGCSIRSLNILEGKSIDTSDHGAYERELGIPEAIARLEDTLFEGLPTEKAALWPERFVSAVNPGADLSLVLPKFYVRLLTDGERGARRNASREGKDAIDMVAKVHGEHAATGSLDEEERAAAWAAARSAAWAAAWAAESAAWAGSAAESAHYEWMADVLVEILEGTE